MMADGLYVYCLARAGRVPPLRAKDLEGKEGLRVQRFRDIAAVWGHADLEEFCGPGSEEKLKDITWVGPRACRHEEVVEEVMLHSPVLPARFGTIFSSPAKLEELLARWHDLISSFLDRVEGQEEWALKGFLERPKAAEALVSDSLAREAGRLAALSPGRRYFEEQRLRAAAGKDLQAWLGDLGRKVAAAFEGVGLSIYKRRLLPPGNSSHDRETVLNWALLMPKDQVSLFKERIDRFNTFFADRGLELECTGPWPPYSFSPSLDREPEV